MNSFTELLIFDGGVVLLGAVLILHHNHVKRPNRKVQEINAMAKAAPVNGEVLSAQVVKPEGSRF
jgi:hypothetical protein